MAFACKPDNLIFIPHNKIWTEPISNSNNGQLEALVSTDLYLAHQVDVDIAETLWGTDFQLKLYPMDARNKDVYKTDLLFA
ncbi:MAG: hypothetical protein GDA56_27910 [Hormoscilla sp. GM7CHS1pb]|nr:hypothetical protein [Hormoscilla sp. GM7CHS1pb]